MYMNRIYWERLLILLGVLFYLFVFPHGIHGDGTVRYEGLKQLFATGKPLEMVYSYVGPLFSAPLMLLGKIYKDDYWWLSRFNTFVFLFTVWFLAKNFVKKEFDAQSARYFILLMFCATMFPKHVTDYYSEIFTACFMALAIYFFLKGKTLLGATLALLSIWNTPGTAAAGALVFLYFLVKEKKWRFALFIVLIAVGISVENYFKFAELWPSKYIGVQPPKTLLPYSGVPGFSYPLFFGILSVIFSYGKGLIFFSPALLSIFYSRIWEKKSILRNFMIVSLLYFVGLLFVFSRWWQWNGDWFWGPRFYLFTSIMNVFFLLLVKEKMKESFRLRIFFFITLSLSLWVGCQGLLFGQDFLEDCYKNGADISFMCHYVPEYSVLWRPFIVQPVIAGRKVAYLIYFILVAITLLWPVSTQLVKDIYMRIKKAFIEAKPWQGWQI